MPPGLYRNERREPPIRGVAEKLARHLTAAVYIKYRNIKGDPFGHSAQSRGQA
jgi:hypothetical protein